MRFMMMVRANRDSEAGIMPSEELLTAMGKYNEQLAQAGALLAGEGLHPSSKGARVKFSGSRRTVVDGPFPENEVIAGFWLIEAGERRTAQGDLSSRRPTDEGDGGRRRPGGERGTVARPEGKFD